MVAELRAEEPVKLHWRLRAPSRSSKEQPAPSGEGAAQPRRGPAHVALLLSLVLLLGGCARGPLPLAATPSATAAPVPPSATPTPLPSPTPTPLPPLADVTVTLPGVLDTLNPLLSHAESMPALAALVFPGLVVEDAKGGYQPGLANRWDSADGRTWTFHLDPTRRWQDGQPVSASDVAYTIGVVTAPDSPAAPELRRAWQGVTVTASGTATVILTAPGAPARSVLALATLPILPAHLLATTPLARLAQAPFAAHPIGSGLYRVASANSLTATLELVGASGMAPRQLDLRFGAAAPPASAEVRALPPGGALAAGEHGFRLASAQPVFVFFNLHHAPVDDVAVRRALAQAVDRAALVRGPLGGGATALRSPLPPGFWVGGATEEPAYDRAAASAALDAAGWRRGADGVRRRNGSTLTVTLLVDGDARRLAVAQTIVNDWRALGVAASVQAVGLDGLVRDFALPGHFQALLLGTRGTGPAPPLGELWHSGGALNISGWSNPVADAAIEAANAPDAATETLGYERFTRVFADDLPAIPLYAPSAAIAARAVDVTPWLEADPSDFLRGAPDWRPAAGG